MVDPLVETKLLLPRLRHGLVRRSGLAEVLRRGARAPLTLVAAPAGFGKTTLVATWVATHDHPVAWVSLDESDARAASYWTYVLLALDRAVPGSGAAALTLLRSGQAPVGTVLAGLVNELSVHPGEVTLVLDDYHLADATEVAAGMAFLLDHLPPQLRLVIATRADPALPLSRLRARGELVEVRASDLRFTDEETADYLHDVHGLDLAADDLALLSGRTEGWAAALQLAALSLREVEDPSGFIAGFAGDDRFVVDYLADEVLDRLPDDVRRFLLDTSVLERLTGPLCEAVGGRPAGRSGRAVLEALERDNLFLVALDARRRWYRYHRLFADVLHAHLLDERPGDLPGLHRRAASWFADAGDPEAAVRHCLAGGDTDRAAELAELALPALRRDRHEQVIRRWALAFPDDVVRRRPVLAMGLVGGLMSSNDVAGVERRLTEVEAQLAGPGTDVVVVDHDELPRLPSAIAMYRTALALIGGDPAGAVARAEQALAVTVDGDDLVVGAVTALSGLASWTTGDLAAAHAAYTASVGALARAGHVADVLGCSIAKADMELRLGRLQEAQRTLEGALDLARTSGGDTVMRGSADMLVGLARVAWCRGDLRGVADLLRRSDELGEAGALAQNPYRWRVGMARLRAAEGDTGAALGLLDEAERVYVGDYSPDVQPVHATRARVLLAHGDLGAARAWAREHGLAADDPLSYLREYEHTTLARLLLAEHATTGSPGSLREAGDLLDRLLDAATAGGRDATVIELEVLRTAALAAGGDQEGARAALAHAVELAAPDGWVRVLVDGGPAVAALLRDLAVRRPSAFLDTLLAATAGPDRPPGREPARPGLVDPLSGRELDVLRLLRSDLDGPAIARELVVSLNTVRTHTKHIYAKLGVNNRRAAISRAHQLGLLAGSGP